MIRNNRPDRGADRSASTTAVTLDNVSVRRGATVALDRVNLSINTGTVTTVIGPNGSGKSTMFALISGRLRPTAGHVFCCGTVSDVLQATGLDPNLRLTVEDVVRMGRYPSLGPLRRFADEDRAECDEAIDKLDLHRLRRRPMTELSGGERQRTLVAQGIAQEAPILLLDEPSTGVDIPSQQCILEAIRDEADKGRAVLFSTHHLPDADVADNVIALDSHCVCCAPPDAALSNPDVLELFGFQAFTTTRPSDHPSDHAD